MTIMRPEGEHKGGTMTISLSSITPDKFFCTGHPEAKPDETYWALSVQDTGISMDTKTIAKIFDPFFTTKEKGKGTGLGLAMVYNIIQQHKGFIDVYSEKGHGSTFSIYLPQMKGGSEAPLKKTQKTLPTGEGAILIIDDEEIMREMAKDILAECGYTTILAENGSEGLEIFKTEHARIVMVLLDMVMPKMSGKETFIEMKQLDPGVKVLLTSGFSKNEDIEGILDLGVVDFIQKPFTLEDLAKKTNAIVHRKS
jgi:CheY-like chemotaxis protein